MRRYAINSQYNMRDLGGYITSNNLYTKWARIIRSDCPFEFVDRDIRQLESLDIQCVIDLRTTDEAKRNKSYFANKESVSYYNVSFENGNGISESEERIPYTYLKMMEEANVINRILRIISDSEGSVLYHCKVGKDRTGIISAIILGICGVPNEEIIADYQVSETYIHNLIDEYKSKNPQLPKWVGKSKPEYMRKCLTMLEDKYESFEGYMNAIQISEDTIEGIRQKLVM